MIELTGIVLLIALLRALYLIRTSRMPTIKETQPNQTPVENLDASEKMSIKDCRPQADYYYNKDRRV